MPRELPEEKVTLTWTAERQNPLWRTISDKKGIWNRQSQLCFWQMWEKNRSRTPEVCPSLWETMSNCWLSVPSSLRRFIHCGLSKKKRGLLRGSFPSLSRKHLESVPAKKWHLFIFQKAGTKTHIIPAMGLFSDFHIVCEMICNKVKKYLEYKFKIQMLIYILSL